MKFLFFLILSISLYSETLSFNVDKVITTSRGIEPSGITMLNGKLFIISDNGFFCELYEDGSSVCKREKNRDYEGLTNNGINLIAVEEGSDNIIYLDREGNKEKSFSVKRKVNGKIVLNKKGNGLEGIAFVKSEGNKDFFFVSNQSKKINGDDKSALLFVSVDKSKNKDAETLIYFPIKIKDISDLFYFNSYLFVLSDKDNKIYIYFFEKNKRLKLEKILENIPGEGQEGIYFYKNTFLIAQDKGNVLVLTPKIKGYSSILNKLKQ